ncbi:MAG: FkbM family methyltransferase [Dokdonella sp.]
MKATLEDVRHAYRLLLGREPDPSGLESFNRMLTEQRMSAPDVMAIISASPEYKTRHETAPALDEIDFHGFKLYPWRGDSLIGGAVQALGDYEPHVLPLFVETVPIGGTVLDVGANIGIFTLSAARKVGTNGRVFAVEPIARNVQSICAGVLGNDLHNVSVLPVAASGAAGVVPMLRNANSSNGIVDTHVAQNMADSFVPAQRIDALLHGLDRLDVIKIDIEGHEPIAWPGLEALVSKHRPVIFTEFSPVAIRNHSRVAAEIYLESLFAYAAKILVIHFDGKHATCTSAEQVMEQWRETNVRAGTDGTCHLDLMLDTCE